MTSETFTVVLTGGIASGKSAVADRFAALGVPVIDTDVIAHELVEPGQSALMAIRDAFGPEVIDSKGMLDRAVMRKHIFEDKKKKVVLEAILHPLIRKEVRRRLEALDTAYCVVVIPLFAESGEYEWVDRVLVVDVPEQVQVSRVMQRDEIERDQAEAILMNQATRAKRLALADDVIENNGPIEALTDRVNALHTHYLELSKRQ